MTINDSLKQLKEFHDLVTRYKIMIRSYKMYFDKSKSLDEVREKYNDIVAVCDELDKYTQN